MRSLLTLAVLSAFFHDSSRIQSAPSERKPNYLRISSVSVIAAPIPKDGKKEDKFEGVWKLESKVNRGRFVDFSKNDLYMSIDVKGRVVCHTNPEPEDEESSGRIEIDREKKWFDYVDDSWPTSNLPASYEMEGDTLKVCSSIKDKSVRPDKVASGPGVVLDTWIRVKPKEKKFHHGGAVELRPDPSRLRKIIRWQDPERDDDPDSGDARKRAPRPAP